MSDSTNTLLVAATRAEIAGGSPGSQTLDATLALSGGEGVADALSGAAAPSAGNVFATVADTTLVKVLTAGNVITVDHIIVDTTGGGVGQQIVNEDSSALLGISDAGVQMAGQTGIITIDRTDGAIEVLAAGHLTLLTDLGNLHMENQAGSNTLDIAADGSITLAPGGVANVIVLGGLSWAGYPTSNPAVAGVLWVDPAAGFVVKVSQG